MTEFSDSDVDRLFNEQMMNDSKRIAYCAVGQEDVVRQIIANRGWAHLIEVRASSIIVDPQQVYIIDENQIAAAQAQRHLKMPNLDEFWNP